MLYSGPLFCMFDTLSSVDPLERRLGERWFRTYVHSFEHILLPLLCILGDSSIALERGVVCVDSASDADGVPVCINFVRPNFNSGQVLYAFETMSLLMKIGDGSMLGPLWTCLVAFPIPWMASDYLIESEQISYAQLILFLCLRLVSQMRAPLTLFLLLDFWKLKRWMIRQTQRLPPPY